MTAHDTTNRVQVAAHHWRPRFVANGIDVNDFDDTVAKTTDWKDWAPNWKEVGEMHEALGREAEDQGRWVSAAQAYQRAAWSWHLGKFLWFEDIRLHGELRDRSVAAYRKALLHLSPPAERLEIPFEDGIIPGNLRRPDDSRHPPLVLLVPGLDSSKEELFAIEDDFLRRGLATLTIDGPGQSLQPRRVLGCAQSAYARRLCLLHEVGRRGRGETQGLHVESRRHPGQGQSADARHARREGSPVPAVARRTDRARSRQRHAGHLPGRQPRVQQHRVQVRPADGGLAARAADLQGL